MDKTRLKVVGKEYTTRVVKPHNGEPLIEGVDLDDIYIRSMYFDKVGESNRPHAHTYDHYTLLATGSCIGFLGGVETTHVAPTIIFTPKLVLHKFTALEPNTALHCINVLHEGEPIVTKI